MGRNSRSGQTTAAAADLPSELPRVYYIEAGFLAVGNLLRPGHWVKDECRSHCNICMQQFHAFRRRHHCRTCGEVLCHSCSKHKKIRLLQLNYDLGVRICTFCVMQATDATQDVRRRCKAPLMRPESRETLACRILGPHGGNNEIQDLPDVVDDKGSDMTWRVTSQMSMCPAWPPTEECTAMSILDCDRQADTVASGDNTLNVLVHLVANSLFCHMVYIGIILPRPFSSPSTTNSHFQVSIGLPPSLVSSDVCSLMWSQEGKYTVVLHDTLDASDEYCPPALLAHGIRYYAGTPIHVRGSMVGIVMAMDVVPHTQTSLEQRNTLELVARIAAEVLEEREAVNEMAKQRRLSINNASPCPDEREQRNTYVPIKDDDDVVDSHEPSTLPSTTAPSIGDETKEILVTMSRRRRQSTISNVFDHGIHLAMTFYRALLRSAWELEREVDGTRLFSLDERFEWGYLKATKVLRVDGKADWNKILDLRHVKVYGDIVASSTKRKMLDLYTTLDVVRFHPATLSRSSSTSIPDEVQLLCHRRQYPGGAWTMIAMDTSDMTFCLAWLISPHSLDEVLVSVVVPHVAAGLTDILLVRLLSRVQEVTTNMGDLRLSACSGTADILETRGMRAYSCSVIPTTTTKREGNGATVQRSQFWDLLSKTILTQQLLTQQQSSMMQTLNENSEKLKRLSNAVDRVESRLDAKAS
ncbi:hypothetical protein, variant [Aphanomyces astaci]|uniref:FYVE-type domain-containing protein n=1 Tax=Aphanomyces astaci TaxID=112090 RepID=W4FND9_APHAT|nr:hypothetical protein, variant [Aphanomyces astaci]ETV68183.1 hypothetical protein, variant [Aphanomyces astaci]|eukprot:XP_009842268.1 hypothetical protein, variant [Aphanomyces astaci]